MTDEEDEGGGELDVEIGCKALPAWFTKRMMTDDWHYGLLVSTGAIICISCIRRINTASDGSLWLDVEMEDQGSMLSVHSSIASMKAILSPTPRTTATINAASVVAAFELAST